MLSPADKALVAATQTGLPLVADPYGALAARLDRSRDEVIEAFARLLVEGAIRRIGIIPNHYAVGIIANGMSVWDVADEAVTELGAKIGALAFVSHCYRRPRHLPAWRYNLFAMVHGRSREEVAEKVEEIAILAGEHARDHRILYSKRILKKTGLRLGA